VRNIARAFARALPAAISGDPIWSKLPAGALDPVEVQLVINAEGRIGAAKLLQDVPLPKEMAKPFARLLKRTMALLQSGTFALSHGGGGRGRETLRIQITLSDGQPSADPNAKPLDLESMGHEPPSLKRRGSGYFTLKSGRHFRATISIVASQPAPTSPADAGVDNAAPRDDDPAAEVQDAGSRGAGGRDAN